MTGSWQVPDVEHALQEPLVESGLAELIAVKNRPDALPALADIVEQSLIRLPGLHSVQAVQDAGGAVDAEASLAGTHPEAEQAPEVVEVRRASPADRIFERSAGDQLALADELVIEQMLLPSMEPLPDAHGLAIFRPG